MKYENFNPEIHDCKKIARYIYDVDFRTFDMLFKDMDSAVETIQKDLKKHEVSPNLKVIFDDDGQTVGMLMAYVSKMPLDIRLKSLRLIVVDILDYFVLCDIEPDDLYVAEIAIDESLRGRGLGREVLNDAIGYAKSKNLKRVILDADFRNTGAKRLYESIGFKVFNKKRVKIAGFVRGMYNMELVL